MISVIVCTYNRCESLCDTLVTLKEQVLDTPLCMEIIVVDNNSNDRTKTVVLDNTADSPFPIRYLFEPRQGISYARNRGINNAKGELIVFTDDDVIVEKDWVSKILNAFSDPTVGGVGGKIIPRWEVASLPRWFSKDLHQNLALIDYGEEPFILDRDRPFYGANMAFRKEVFQKIGSFRTDLGRKGKILLGSEDTEIFKRAFDVGFHMLYDPKVCVHHVVGEDRMTKSYFRRYHFRAGQTIVLSGRDSGKKYSSLFGMPLWRVRQYLSAAFRLVLGLVTVKRQQAFLNELKLLEAVGYASVSFDYKPLIKKVTNSRSNK